MGRTTRGRRRSTRSSTTAPGGRAALLQDEDGRRAAPSRSPTPRRCRARCSTASPPSTPRSSASANRETSIPPAPACDPTRERPLATPTTRARACRVRSLRHPTAPARKGRLTPRRRARAGATASTTRATFCWPVQLTRRRLSATCRRSGRRSSWPPSRRATADDYGNQDPTSHSRRRQLQVIGLAMLSLGGHRPTLPGGRSPLDPRIHQETEELAMPLSLYLVTAITKRKEPM